jgi:hypothetical protein
LAAQEAKFAIVRDRIPEFFVAYKNSGEAVWSHDKKFAKILTPSQADHFTSSLTVQGFNVELVKQ